MVIFHSYVSLPGGSHNRHVETGYPKKLEHLKRSRFLSWFSVSTAEPAKWGPPSSPLSSEGSQPYRPLPVLGPSHDPSCRLRDNGGGDAHDGDQHVPWKKKKKKQPKPQAAGGTGKSFGKHINPAWSIKQQVQLSKIYLQSRYLDRMFQNMLTDPWILVHPGLKQTLQLYCIVNPTYQPTLKILQ